MVSSGLWMSVWMLGFMCLLMPGSGNQLLREGEKCGAWIERECESGLICLSNTPSTILFYAEGICTRISTCNCSEFQCTPFRSYQPCSSRRVVDPCGCCSHCPKEKAQVCGGPSWKYGNCDSGLVCSLIVGLHSINPPQTGVCKEIPDHLKDNFPIAPCPVQYGCNVHVGSCDCYSDDSCEASFSYSTFEACNKVQQADLYYDHENPENNPPPPTFTCTEWACEVQGCKCVCKHKKCAFRKPLYEAECCNILKESGCPNATCPEIAPPPCPADSFITKPHFEPGQCCPDIHPMCTCNFQACAPKPTNCPLGQLPKVVRKGTGYPGNCCDHYGCVKDGD